ncbi:hypothetical protein ACRE_018270 [Hapsidospora chrysogenum ATCC 11550]|uniref:Uncharacterized protein n=1 Tax=Hapsidospora chrysogenum (strain ATCC 11550 / CBS 779.69 / DSM 880 / IAM 14645 / JCM 23072 / IMI 49137) TaxID=857340 RepID=A0A086TDC4_HAPC1|nr:hypothetical protein ACRE_018270 [Hapsidospora chrysogenum ATCC 11550]
MPNLAGKETEYMPAAKTPSPDFSSTAYFQRLSDLNARILSSSAKTHPDSYNAQVLKEVVDFSGELIDTARHSMPYFVGSMPPPSRASTLSMVESSASGDKSDAYFDFRSRSMSNHSAMAGSGWQQVIGSYPRDQCVPESGPIFLLLGCYAQILHLFEVTTNCIWAQYCDQASAAVGDETGTVGSLLETSLDIHTVRYLLNRLHKAFALQEKQEGLSGMSEDHVDFEGWERSFVGGEGLGDGLLGRTLGEIREREQRLVRRTQLLQQRMNKCYI